MCPLQNQVHCGLFVERADNNGMKRWCRNRNLKIVMEISGSDVNFLAIVERQNGGVVGKDDKVYKKTHI